MPVSDALAYRLLRAFGMVEFLLKHRQGFLAADGDPAGNSRAKAKADWSAVDRAMRHLRREEFLDCVSRETRDKVLGGGRNRPKMQFVRVNNDGTWRVDYETSILPLNDAEALVVAMRRVRNNLFHGGKEDPLEEHYPGDDDEWATAAAEIAELLRDLLDNHRLRPA